MTKRGAKPLKYEDHTFGNSPAEVALAKILQEKGDVALSKSATKYILSVTGIIKNVYLKHDNYEQKEYLFSMIRSYTESQIDNNPILQKDPDVTSFLKNCVVIRLRQWKEGNYARGNH